MEDAEIKPIFFTPEVVEKGWGREVIIDNTAQYCGKLLEFNEGAKFSMHMHMKKQETFLVAKGKVSFYFFNLQNADFCHKEVGEGECIRIPVGCPHQIEALEESTIIEVSTHHEDSDSYRIAKGDSQK